MPRSAGDSRRLPPTKNDDVSTDDEMFSDDWEDPRALIDAANEIESAHTSPVKSNPPTRLGASPPRSASSARQQPRRARAEENQNRNGAPSRASNREPQTPQRRLHNSTPASRRTAATALLSRMTLSSASVDDNMDGVARRLFHPSASATTPMQNHGTIVISDTEDEISEVSNMLTDTEDSDEAPRLPRNTQNSMSSTGVTPLFARVSTDESFTSISSVGSTSFQSNRATIQAVGQSSARYSPSKGPLTKGARPSSVRIRTQVQDALDNPMPAPVTPKAGTAASSSSTTQPMTRQSRHSTDHSTPRAKAPIKVGRDSPRPAAAASSSAAPSSMQAPKSGPSPALLAFVKQDIGGGLDRVEICHNRKAQEVLDRANIAWGVQWELARGVLEERWDWDAVIEKIDALKGSNAAIAPRVTNIMQKKPTRGSLVTTLWEQMDHEQDAILENLGRGLGCMGPWKGENPWWGGRIQQIARLEDDKDNDSFKIMLEPLEQRRCHRLARYLGSRRVLQLRIAQDFVMSQNEKLLDFLSRKFVLCGRVFVPLSSKDNGVYLVEVNEDFERKPCTKMGDQYRQGLKETIRWANSLEENCAQPISKWSARFALTLSNSVPILEFAEDKIFYMDDDYAPSYNGVGKAAAEQILTDGCCYMNAAAFRRIQSLLGLSFRPTAVQGRIKGAKGMWTLHPNNDDQEPKIWLRKSQIKVELKAPLHRSQRIFDLLAYSKPSNSVSLSSQTIMNLHFNGVPAATLVELMEKGLREEAEPLMKWEGPHAMQILWNTISRLGGVPKTRAVRIAGALSRALGLENREFGGEDVEMKDPKDAAPDAEDLDDAAVASASGRRPHCGLPQSLHEVALELLQAGFKPQEFDYLRQKVKYIMEQYIKTIIEKFNIPLSLAVDNFVIPDPCGVLAANEVYYRSSSALVDPATQLPFNVFDGPVLIGRYPVRLPSDIQKFIAVDKPELAQYPDVLIVSTKGPESVASLLSGGDYDGDECFLFADPAIVDPFKNKPLSKQPDDLMDDFEKDVTLIEDFIKVAQTDHHYEKSFVKQLLLGLHDSKKGLYSTFHDMAVWKHGYDHRKAIKLAYKFNTLLDSGKTGHRLKAQVFEKDQKAFGGKLPAKPNPSKNEKPSILHILSEAGSRVTDELNTQFDAFPASRVKDKDLEQPFKTSLDQVTQGKSEVLGIKVPPSNEQVDRKRLFTMGDLFLIERECIRNHVLRAYERWEAIDRSRERDEGPAKKKPRIRRVQKDPMFGIARDYHAEIEGIHNLFNTKHLKASFAYYYSPTFALKVAFNDLCEIKAKSTPEGLAPIARVFDEAKAITNPYMRAISSILPE